MGFFMIEFSRKIYKKYIEYTNIHDVIDVSYKIIEEKSPSVAYFIAEEVYNSKYILYINSSNIDIKSKYGKEAAESVFYHEFTHLYDALKVKVSSNSLEDFKVRMTSYSEPHAYWLENHYCSLNKKKPIVPTTVFPKLLGPCSIEKYYDITQKEANIVFKKIESGDEDAPDLLNWIYRYIGTAVFYSEEVKKNKPKYYRLNFHYRRIIKKWILSVINEDIDSCVKCYNKIKQRYIKAIYSTV